MNKYSIYRMILGFFLLFGTACSQPETDREITNEDYVTVLGFKLEETKIAEIQNVLGNTPAVISGDGAEYSKHYTYFLIEEGCYLTFDVTEMGGDSTILFAKLARETQDSVFHKVADFNLDKYDFGGLRLGMSKDSFLQQFPDASETDPGTLFKLIWFTAEKESGLCVSRHGIPLDEIESCDVEISIWARFEKQKAIELSVSKLTTF